MNMIHSWQLIWDSVFPPTDHELLLRNYHHEDMSRFLQPRLVGSVTAISDYHDPVIQAAVAAAKFEHSFRAAALLRALVSNWLHTQAPQPTILLPIPLSPARERRRGYNQVTRVIDKIKISDWPVSCSTSILYRTKDTLPQTSLKQSERLENLSRAFAVNKKSLDRIEPNTRLIIFDDVVTTGATLKAARAALAPSIPPTATLICAAFAH